MTEKEAIEIVLLVIDDVPLHALMERGVDEAELEEAKRVLRDVL